MMNTDMVRLLDEDFGILAVCALRYAMGRETYMPELVRSIVGPRLSKVTDKDLGVMLEDCRRQAAFGNYGHETIDKPGWMEWEKKLQAEKRRREDDE